jgi:hypothetical protein
MNVEGLQAFNSSILACKIAFSSLRLEIEIVDTLNQGYPLLQYEDTVPVWRSLATR